MNIEEKIPYMIEWWRTVQSFLIRSNLNKSMMQEIVHQSAMELRKGVRPFFLELFKDRIPVLIFSAGLGDVIDIFFQKEIPEFKEHSDTTHIVSNFIEYDDHGQLVAFSEKLIHSFNKNEHEIHHTPYTKTINHRPNVILLGDTLGDVGMASGIKNLQNILKIGFLNQATPNKLDVYQIAYDIVICDNETFDVPNLILNAI